MKMASWLARTELLIGAANVEKLRRSHVLVAGLGGVGAAAAEMLCRAGAGGLTLVDGDTIHETNLNRQIPALRSTAGQNKAEVMAARLLDINPELKVHVVPKYVKADEWPEILDLAFDYVVDAIDTLSPKVMLLFQCMDLGLKTVSSMGSGGKTDPAQVRITSIWNTNNCTFAYDIRKRLRKLGAAGEVQAVFSPEAVPASAKVLTSGDQNKKSVIGTLSYMPNLFGCLCASVVVRGLLEVGDGVTT